MAWNGSNKQSAKITVVTSNHRKRSPVILAVSVGLIVITLGSAVIWRFAGAEKDPVQSKTIVKETHKSVAIVESVSTSRVEVIDSKEELSPVWQKYYDGRDTNKWVVVKDRKTGKERLSRKVTLGRINQPPPLYKSHALNMLDALAFRPAMSPMLNSRIDQRFQQSFQEGVDEKIEILPTDSEEIKARKQGMLDLRKELVQRVKGGESIETIVKDTIKERNAIATYRRMMQIEYSKLKRDGEDPDVVEAFGDKCNEILNEKGAAPIMTQKRMEEVFKTKK